MYFTDETIAKTAPEFMLLRSQGKGNASTKHLTALFHGFFRDRPTEVKFNSGTNFIERIFLDILNNNLQKASGETLEACYLPFVAERFHRDVLFLSKHPDFFLDQLTSCIELYTFIYCSQLGLNIRNWTNGESPSSKPLYFILDTEKASSERSNLVNYVYKTLARPMAEVFPILSMLEHFNNDQKCTKVPLWAFANALQNASPVEQQSAFESLKAFAERFREERKLTRTSQPPSNAIEGMKQVVYYGVKQFAEGTGRHRVQAQYMDVFDKEVAKNFIRVRGRSGKVLVVNQDFILLLTNLAIADRESVRFQELLTEFQMRGFYFDKSSQQALINFYERVGNVDRMSDSGDAVYVRNTI
jgi:DNA phosphorothioation-dependent restriction protein DptG